MNALVAAALLARLAAPAKAPGLDVRLVPPQPRLGDTLSVFVTLPPGAPPSTVSAGKHAALGFDLGGGRYRAFIPISPLDRPGRWTIEVNAGAQQKKVTVTVKTRPFGLQRIWLRGKPTELSEFERTQVGKVKALATPEKRWTGAFRAPAGGRISSPFGVKRYRNGVFLTDYYHRGIDYAPGGGAPVVAPADAVVALVGMEADGFVVHGNTVGLDHGHGVVSLMLHLSRVAVKVGDRVSAGDPIGLVGGTGAATAPHLHWGLYVGGVAIDPLPWLGHEIE
jgi:murein DD-endopeptidase MepM/ murein hydrolase activator NlpD